MAELPAPPERPQRLAYLGTPAVAVPPLRALVDAGHDVALVVTRGDRRRGRGGATGPSPVKSAAEELGIRVSHHVDDLVDAGVDLGVVVAFGELIRTHVLERLPLVNLHFSLLPRWRGAAPVERAVLAGDPITGVCLMAVEPELDTGGIYRRAELEVGDDESVDDLRRRLADIGTTLLLDALAHGFGPATPQVGEPSYAAKVGTEERRLDWTRPAEELHRVVRVGGAWTTFRARRLKVWRTRRRPDRTDLAPGELEGVLVGTADQALELCEVQPEGRSRQDATSWQRGARIGDGDRLGA